jgi:adenylosuccinate synthase
MKIIREKGEEFGATTGRPRRCGWFDAVIGRHAVMVNGIDELAVMKLDVLDDLEKIKICTAYRVNGKILKTYPTNIGHLNQAVPIYTELPGWREDTTGVTRYQDLPRNAQRYLKFLSKILEAPIRIISVGSKRSQTIFLK